MSSANRLVAAALFLAVVCSRPATCSEQEKPAQAPPRTAAELIDRLERAVSVCEDYTCTCRTENDGKGETFKLYFKRPNLVRVDTDRGEVAVQPDGAIRARRGRGWFGSISRHMDRNDRRVVDSEGIPFYERHFAAIIDRIREQIKQGARVTMEVHPLAYGLIVQFGDTVWRYTFDRERLIPLGCSRTVNGKVVEVTECSDIRINTGLRTGLFRF